MKRSFALMSLIAVCIIGASFCYMKAVDIKSSREISLEKAFDSSGAFLMNSAVYVWGRLDENIVSVEPLRPVISEIISGMNIIHDERFHWNSMENDVLLKTEVSGMTLDGSSISMEILINKEQNKAVNQQAKEEGESSSEKGTADFGKAGGRYISVNVVKDLSSDRLSDDREIILQIFKDNNIKAETNSCITGTFDGEIDMQGIEDISGKILSEAGAKRIEGVKDRNYISVSAYSPYIQDYIQVRGKRVNLNLAARYNSYEDKTYIWLATPVITTEY